MIKRNRFILLFFISLTACLVVGMYFLGDDLNTVIRSEGQSGRPPTLHSTKSPSQLQGPDITAPAVMPQAEFFSSAQYAEHPHVREAATKHVAMAYAEYLKSQNLTDKERTIIFSILVDSFCSDSITETSDYENLLRRLLGEARYKEYQAYNEYYPRRNRTDEALRTVLAFNPAMNVQTQAALRAALLDLPFINPEYREAMKIASQGGSVDTGSVRQSYADFLATALEKHELNSTMSKADLQLVSDWYMRIAQNAVNEIETLKNIKTGRPLLPDF